MRARAAVALVLATLVGSAGCSMFFGVVRRARLPKDVPVSAARIAAALRTRGIETVRQRADDSVPLLPLKAVVERHRSDCFEFEATLEGLEATPKGHGLVIVEHEGSDGAEISVSWGRINRPWSAAQCERMATLVSDLYDAIQEACPGLPPVSEPQRHRCAD